MESIKKKVPGMEGIIESFNTMKPDQSTEAPKEKVIIDENYSTSKVDVPEMKEKQSDLGGLNIGKILKTVDSLGILPSGSKENKSELPNISDMMKMLNNPTNTPSSTSSMPGMSDMMKMLNSIPMNKTSTNGEQVPNMDVMMKMMETPEFKHMMSNIDMSSMNEMLKPANMDKVSKQVDDMLKGTK
jgi:hypothetical protein